MYIAVCDDQLEELNEILALLQLWQTENNTILRVRTFRSAVELVDAAQREHFTLYLLDVIMPGMDGFDIFYGGFRGVTIRAVVLLPYLIACLMERKYFGVILCVLAEACMVWTLYGAGVCLLVTLGWVMLHKLLSLLPGRRKKEAAG